MRLVDGIVVDLAVWHFHEACLGVTHALPAGPRLPHPGSGHHGEGSLWLHSRGDMLVQKGHLGWPGIPWEPAQCAAISLAIAILVEQALGSRVWMWNSHTLRHCS